MASICTRGSTRSATITERAPDSTTFGVDRWCGCWLWKEKGEGGGRFAVVVGLLWVSFENGGEAMLAGKGCEGVGSGGLV